MVLCVASALPGWAEDSQTVQTIRNVVTRADHPDLKWPEFPHYKNEMQELYAPSNFQPFWFVNGQPRPQVAELIEEIRMSPLRGLDPTDYDAEFLETARVDQAAGKLSERDLGLFDTALSITCMRLISDLHIGRITPATVGIAIDPSGKKYDLAPLVRGAVEGNRLRTTIDVAEPRLAVYRRMKEALVTYRTKVDANLLQVQASQTVRPGEAFAGLSALRARLRSFGDLSADAAAGDPAVYDAETVAAVKRFQDRHGLTADGVIGKGTLGALNVSPAVRVRQIELGLERLRWVPSIGPGKFITVNIPAFTLWAFDSLSTEGRPALSMRVVVGKSFKHQTPVFFEQMEYIVFRPYWNVPYSIVKSELLPSVRRNPNYLTKKNMEIVRDFGAPPGGLPATSDNIAKLANGTLKVREKPGPGNALGLAKFIFPNSANVYLHGTPSQSAFGRERRDLSHGCVRLENPTAMAQFVLGDQPEWTLEKIQAAMNAERPQQVNLTRHVPVLLFYTTALVDLDGRLHFFDDIYGHDAALERELESAYSYQP